MSASTIPSPSTKASPVFFVGDDRRKSVGDDKIVAVSVTVNLVCREGEREFSASAGLHELPVLRRFYDAIGGNITINKSWVPGVPRQRTLNQDALATELERLTNTYIVRADGKGVRNITAEVYGPTPSEQLRNIHKAMKEIMQAWAKLEEKGLQRVMAGYPKEKLAKLHPQEIAALAADEILDREIDEVIALADPQTIALNEIELSHVQIPGPEKADAVTESVAGGEDPEEALQTYFQRAGLKEDTAIDLATLCVTIGAAKVTDAQLGTVRGLDKVSKETLSKVKTLLAAVPKVAATVA